MIQSFPQFPSTKGRTSAATEDSVQISGSENGASLLILDVRDEGSWVGVLKVAGRVIGAGKDGENDYADHLSIKNRDADQAIDGDTGIVAQGIYEINIAGLEVIVQHTSTSGTVGVRAHIVYG